MIGLAWTGFMVASWLLVVLWSVPVIIAYRRQHRNIVVIAVFTVIFSIFPHWLVGALGWLLLLGFSLYRSPEHVYIPGPVGPRGKEGRHGRKGRDADEIPLSKGGVLSPRGR